MADEFKIVASLNIEKSTGVIKEDIKKLQDQIKNEKVKIVAGLDIGKSKNLIQSQLNTLANQAKAPTIKIGVDTSGLNSVQGATQNITNSLQTVQIQAQNTTQSIINLEDKFKTPIKPVFNSDGLINAEETILRVKQHFQELGEVSVKGQYSDKNAVDSLDTMIVKIQNGQKEARSLTFELDKAGKAFYLKSGTSDNSGVAKLSTQIDETRAKYNRLLADFKSSNSAIQSGLTQPIQQFETVLNGLGKTSSINDVKNAFESLKQSASEITAYLDTTNSSFNKATNAVNNYKNMDNILKDMTASFNNLVMKPENLRTELDGVKSKLIELQNLEKTEGGYTKAWAEKYREVNLELAQVKTNIELALKAEGSSQKADKNSAYQTQLKYLNKIKEETNTIISLKRKMVNAGDEEKSVYQHEITNAQKRIQYDTQQLEKKKLLTDEAKRLVNTYKEQIALQDKINSAKTSDKNVQAQSQQLKDYVTQVSKAITLLNSLQNSSTFTKNASDPKVIQTKQEITQLLAEYQNLKTQMQGNITPAGLESIGNQLTQLNARFNTTTTTAQRFESELKNDNGAEKLAQRVALLKAQLEALAKANPKALTRFGNEINSLMATLNSNPDARAVDQATKSVQLLRREINNADLAGKTFFQNLGDKIKKFTGWMSMTYAISLATRTIRNMITEVVNLDTALIDLKKTFKGTNSDLQDFYYEANNVAKQLGVTTEEVINTASSWSRLGYSTKEAAIAMSKYASMFKMISPNMSMEDSTDGLLSVMKAFDIEVNDVLDGIMSKINKVGNEFGTSNNEIVQMLMRSSSAMREGNNTLAETIALETSAVEITRDYASVGTAYKTLAMRLRGYDEELETYSNDVQVLSGEIADLTKTAKKPSGVSLFKDEAKTEYKSTLEILRDIREVYDDLDDKTQAQLLEKIAGKRQGQIVAATLSNWDTVEKALVAMENADGSALNEMNTIMESISYRANIFKETLVGIAQGLFSQDFMKSMVDSGTRVLNVFEDLTPSISFILEQFATLLEFVTKLADAIGGIPLLIAGIGLKNVGSPKMFGLVLICQQ